MPDNLHKSSDACPILFCSMGVETLFFPLFCLWFLQRRCKRQHTILVVPDYKVVLVLGLILAEEQQVILLFFSRPVISQGRIEPAPRSIIPPYGILHLGVQQMKTALGRNPANCQNLVSLPLEILCPKVELFLIPLRKEPPDPVLIVCFLYWIVFSFPYQIMDYLSPHLK